MDLAGWYVPSSNGAAVVLRHGSGSTRTDVLDQAAAIARGGYGVLLTDARGHGESGGRAMDFGWFGDADTTAAVTFLTEQPDVDADRIGVVGMSMGGEEAIGAAAADPRISAVVAEGATGRTDADVGLVERCLRRPGHVAARDRVAPVRIGRRAHVGARADQPGRRDRRRTVDGLPPHRRRRRRRTNDMCSPTSPQSAPANLTTWIVPDAGHTQGLDRRTDRVEHTRDLVPRPSNSRLDFKSA